MGAKIHPVNKQMEERKMPKPHPVCIMSLVVKKGLTPTQAASECVKAGKFHGISKLAEEYRKIVGKTK